MYASWWIEAGIYSGIGCLLKEMVFVDAGK